MPGTAWAKGILYKSTTLSDHGDDAYTGMIRHHLGREYMLVKSADTIGNGEVVCKNTTTGEHLTVTIPSAVTTRALGVNQIGSTVLTGYFFWVLIRGRGFCVADGTWVDSDMVGPSATPGATAAVASVALGTVYGIAIKDSSTTTTSNAIQFDFGFGYSAAS